MSAPYAVVKPSVSSGAISGRWQILGLLAIGTMINYLDRTVLGVVAPALSADLRFSPEMMGVVFSVFSWSYAAAQLPGGWFLDRFGNKLTNFLAVTLWSLFTLLQGFSRGLTSLLAFRLGLGLAESPCFPVNGRVVAEWFPERERARATAVYTVGEYVGLACFGPAMFWVVAHFGWRTLFYLAGTVGILFGTAWWKLYREPDSQPAVPVLHAVARKGPTLTNVRRLLGFRQVWGASIGQFGGNSTLVFFLTWFPTYLMRERHLDWIRSGNFAVLPYFAAACGLLAGGWLSDYLLRQGRSLSFARKLPVIAGLLGSATIILANYATSDFHVIAVLSAAFFAQGMTGLGWTVISEIAPISMMGLTGGIFNLAANLAGILTPLVIGLILGATGSFYWALAYVAALALIGAVSYIFLLGEVKRIDLTAMPE